jgi:hypothetical protein
MLEISTVKVAQIIVRAREYDAKVGTWEHAMSRGFREEVGNSFLQNFATDSTRSELAEFIGRLNADERASLVALAWLGRGSFAPDKLDDAIETAKSEKVNKTQDYLIGIPLLADYLEDGLDKLGFSVEHAEKGIL